MNTCPHCGVSLQGEPIPEETREKYYGNQTHYRRDIGIEVQGIYDGVLYYICPDCGGAWHRWREEWMRKRAQPYIDDANEKMKAKAAIPAPSRQSESPEKEQLPPGGE